MQTRPRGDGRCASAGARSLAVRPGRRPPIRRAADAFDLGLEPTGGSSHSDEAIELARRITFVFGPQNMAVQHYEQLFGYAPAQDLRALQERGAIIVMTPEIPDWLCSEEAADRRGRPLTGGERTRAKREHGPGTGTAAVYDPQTDSLVLPTDEISSDPLHPVLHELGHALTLDGVWNDFRNFTWLLGDLPPRIRDHLAGGYPQGDDEDALRIQIAEVFAEAYAMALAGRDAELTPDLASALVGILADMGQQGTGSGGSVDPDSGRTATYVPRDTMIREGRGVEEPGQPRLTRAGNNRLLRRKARPWPPISRT